MPTGHHWRAPCPVSCPRRRVGEEMEFPVNSLRCSAPSLWTIPRASIMSCLRRWCLANLTEDVVNQLRRHAPSPPPTPGPPTPIANASACNVLRTFLIHSPPVPCTFGMVTSGRMPARDSLVVSASCTRMGFGGTKAWHPLVDVIGLPRRAAAVAT